VIGCVSPSDEFLTESGQTLGFLQLCKGIAYVSGDLGNVGDDDERESLGVGVSVAEDGTLMYTPPEDGAGGVAVPIPDGLRNDDGMLVGDART
jgi:hypothetical protein